MLNKYIGKLTFWKVAFGLIMAAGLYSTYVRFFHGLGAATNLSDQFPWGLWIAFDVMVGVGLAAGGFVIAATVHIFRIEKYEPIARPTILTAFLGYSLVTVALLFDIGHPYRLWHPLVMWNPHSVMFEVAWCVTLYSTVLALEFSPMVFQRLGWVRPLRWIKALYLPIVIFGVLLSTMHQSSLGTLYVIMPDKLNGLWYTPMLPVFFFISAISVGLAMTIFESYMSQRAFGKRLESGLLQGLARVLVVILMVYFVWRVLDLKDRGNLPLAFQITPEGFLFWGELGLGVILPMILLAIPAVRQNEQGMFFAAMLTIMGFIVNRLNVAITGMARTSGVNYFPSWMELSVTIMIVAIGFVIFSLAVKYLPIFESEGEEAEADVLATARRKPAWHGGVILGLWGLLLIGFVGTGYAFRNYKPAPKPTQSEEQEAAKVLTKTVLSSLKLPAAFTFPSGADSPGKVTFRHETHVKQNKVICHTCHEKLFKFTESGQPVAGGLSQDRIHNTDLCQSCHNGTHAFGTDNCERCHIQ